VSNPGEILIEFVKIGNAVRVVAFDVATSVEISFQAPANTSRATIERIARDKLKYVIQRGKG
jgi:hypothetical protein